MSIFALPRSVNPRVSLFDLVAIDEFNANVHRRIVVCSWKARCLIILVVAMAPFCVAVAATPSHVQGDDLTPIEICSDDSPEAAAAFVRATLQVLMESGIRLLCRCDATGRTRSASFIPGEEEVSLQLRLPTRERSARVVPWLRDTQHPLATTMTLGKATTLALFLGNLVADLQILPLRHIPALPVPPLGTPTPSWFEDQGKETQPPPVAPAPVASSAAPLPSTPVSRDVLPRVRPSIRDDARTVATAPPTPAESASPASTPLAPAAEAPAPAPPSAFATARAGSVAAATQRSFELSLPLVGVSWMAPSTLAPQIEAGLGWGGPRWWAVATGVVELDSNFAMDGRTFTSAGYGLRLGMRRTLLGSRRFRWDADATVVGHMSQYRRDGIPDAHTHTWFDLGAGLHSRTSFSWGRHVRLIVVIGAQFFPTAREASIPEGPNQRINLVSLSAVGGPCFAF